MLKQAYSYALERAVMPVGDKLHGGGFMQWLKRYRQEQWLPADEMRRLGRERLSAILRHARSNVPFYEGTGTAADDPLDDLRQFPVITKAELKENIEALITCPVEGLIAESGSGSSGIQGTVYMDKSAQASQRAMQMLWFEWCGYRMGDRVLQTGITPDRGWVKRTKDVLLHTEYISAFQLSETAITRLLESLREAPRKYFFGYASSLYVIAEAAIKLGFDDIRFEHAVSWGDKLFPHYRTSILKAFGCRTMDTYGCTEGAMIAAECPEGNYHLSVNQCHVEILDDDGHPLPDGELGNVVATRLDNFAMPLVRYKLGDIAALEPAETSVCTCGRQTPLLRGLIGRDTDVVISRSGKKMIVHFFTGIFEHVPEIRQFRVVQETLDRIAIEYIPDSGFNRGILEEIERRIHAKLDESFPIDWIAVDKISPTGSGKPQIVQSFLRDRVGDFTEAQAMPSMTGQESRQGTKLPV
jgi:phenylacetate-CoA ligase